MVSLYSGKIKAEFLCFDSSDRGHFATVGNTVEHYIRKKQGSNFPFCVQFRCEDWENIYNAIGALSVKYQDPPKPKMNPIGYAATAARYEEEERRKKAQQNNQ